MSDSLLRKCPLSKNIVYVLLFHIRSHLVSSLITFLNDLLTGTALKKIILSGHVETNPVPQSKCCQQFSTYQWNLNSMGTHSFIKVSLLKAYITIYNYDITCFISNISRFKHSVR